MDQKIQIHIPREVKIWTRATQISFQTKNSDDFYDVQNNALIFSFDKALLGQIIVKLFTPFNISLTANSYRIFPKIYHQKRNRCVKLGPCQASGCRVSFATRLTDCSEFQKKNDPADWLFRISSYISHLEEVKQTLSGGSCFLGHLGLNGSKILSSLKYCWAL